MFTIGRFAALTGVSAKRLRHYDALGLFRPAYVDPESRYRYYAAAQIPQLQRIVSLRSFGIPLRTIGRIAAEGRGALQEALDERRKELLDQQQRLERSLAALDIELSSSGGLDVVVRRRPPGRWASVRRALPSGADLGPIFVEVERAVGRAGVRARRPPAAVLHGIGAGGERDVTVLVPIDGPVTGEPVSELRTPAARVASMLVEGDYPTIADAAQRISSWSAAAGYRLSGPVWLVYLRFSAEPELSVPGEFLAQHGAFVTEIQAEVAR